MNDEDDYMSYLSLSVSSRTQNFINIFSENKKKRNVCVSVVIIHVDRKFLK